MSNSKIIHSLPFEEDRLLVGKSAALKDIQIDELARLPRGVAAIYQNDWVEAVLCNIEEAASRVYANNEDINDNNTNEETEDASSINIDVFLSVIFGLKESEELVQEREKINSWISELSIPANIKRVMRKSLRREMLSETERKKVAYCLFNGKNIARKLMDSIKSAEDDIKETELIIKNTYSLTDDSLAARIRELLLQSIDEKLKTEIISNRYIDFMGKRVR